MVNYHKAQIKIQVIKPNAFSKESRVNVEANFFLKELGALPSLGNINKDIWVRLPKNVEPGDMFSILVNGNGSPYLDKYDGQPSLLDNPIIMVGEDLFVWLVIL